jgi:hypothetical protein
VSRRTAFATALALSLAAAAAAPAAPAPARTPNRSASPNPEAKSARAPLNFSGTWDLDFPASRGVIGSMREAALEVQQDGNRITISPLGPSRTLLQADQIVVDGRPYEKKMGRDRGTITAQWGNDGTSLWLQAIDIESTDNPRPMQRSVWRLRDFGSVWTRQTWTITGDKKKQTLLVFRRRRPGKSGTPRPVASPGPTKPAS